MDFFSDLLNPTVHSARLSAATDLEVPTHIDNSLSSSENIYYDYYDYDFHKPPPTTASTTTTTTTTTTRSPIIFFPGTPDSTCKLAGQGSSHSLNTFSLVALLLSIFNIVTLLVQNANVNNNNNNNNRNDNADNINSLNSAESNSNPEVMTTVQVMMTAGGVGKKRRRRSDPTVVPVTLDLTLYGNGSVVAGMDGSPIARRYQRIIRKINL